MALFKLFSPAKEQMGLRPPTQPTASSFELNGSCGLSNRMSCENRTAKRKSIDAMNSTFALAAIKSCSYVAYEPRLREKIFY